MFTNSWMVLAAAGLTVDSEAISHGRADAVFNVRVDDIKFTLAVEFRARAPYPSEIPQLSQRRDELSAIGIPILMSQYVSEGTGSLLSEAGWSWLDRSGNADIATRGVRIQRRVGQPDSSAAKASRLPTGDKAWRVVRQLIESDLSASVTALGTQAEVSQPRTSQILRDIEDLELIERTGRSSWTTNRRALAEAFIEQYPGPGGSATWWYSLDPPSRVAHQLVGAYPHGLISGDPAADQIAPWGTPAKTVFYPNGLFEPIKSLVEAQGPGDGNVQIVHHNDRSIRAAVSPHESLIRPSQLIWDLHALGGDTRSEMIDRVITWMTRS